jgi:hypothetical protein
MIAMKVEMLTDLILSNNISLLITCGVWMVNQDFNFHYNNLFKEVIDKKGTCSKSKWNLSKANPEWTRIL